MRFLIFVWITLAVAAAGSAWYAMQPLSAGRRLVRDRRLRRPVGRVRDILRDAER